MSAGLSLATPAMNFKVQRMNDQQRPDVKLPDPVELSKSMTRIAGRSQRLVTEFLRRQTNGGSAIPAADPLSLGRTFLEMTARMMADPAKLMQAQMNLWQDYLKLWQSTTRRMLGQETEPVIEPNQDDRRFKRRSLERESGLRFHQAVLSADRAVDAVDGPQRRRARRQDGEEG